MSKKLKFVCLGYGSGVMVVQDTYGEKKTKSSATAARVRAGERRESRCREIEINRE